MTRPGGLGKGLGALIPTAAEERAGGPVQEAPVTSIRPNPYQPRQDFDEESLAELTASIREVGILQPVLVRPVDDGYELIAGERRWKAARRAGLHTIPVLVRETDDASTLEHALIENVHRTDLNSLEEAAAYQQLTEDFGLTHEEVAARVGRSRTAVTNTLRLLALPASIQRLVREDRLSAGHARALLATPDRSFQEALAQRVVKEGLSVRAVEDEIRARSAEPSDDGERASTPPRLPPPGLLELAELLGEFLDTRVEVKLGARRGRVVVEFSDLGDLERIYRRIVPG